jgi:hypothetical protein
MTTTADAFKILISSLKCFTTHCNKDMELVKIANKELYKKKIQLLNDLKLHNTKANLNKYIREIRKLYTELNLSKVKSNEFDCEMSTCKMEYIKVINIVLDNVIKRSDLKKSEYTLKDIIEISKITTESLITNEVALIKSNIDMAIELNTKQLNATSSFFK